MWNFIGGFILINFLNLTVDDVIYAALLALFVTIVIKNALRVRQILKNAQKITVEGKALDINAIMNKCYTLFPKDEIVFGGIKYKRGMKIKIVTTANTTFEGEFIGGNEKNMLCIKTNKYIVAHEVKDISSITTIN